MNNWNAILNEIRPEAVRQANRYQIFSELQGTIADVDIDFELVERAANLLQLFVYDLLHEKLADDNERREELRMASADAFRLFRILPRTKGELSNGLLVLRTSALGVLGDMGADAARWLRVIHWPVHPLENTDWRDRTWTTVLDIWLRLIRKDGWSDRDAVLGKINHLRNSQTEFEGLYLEELEPEYASAAALELIGLYHLTRAAEIFAIFMTEGSVDGKYQIRPLLETQFGRVMSVCKHAQLIELEVISKLLLACANQMTENSIWTVTRAVNSRVNDFVHSLVDKNRGNRTIFDVLPPQSRTLAEKGLLGSSRRSVVVSLPTSSGKTLIAEFRILQALNQFELERGWVVYLTSTRALVNQISRQLRRDLEPLNIIVEQISPALEIDSVESELLCQRDPENEFRVLVTTPEKLNLMLRQGWEEKIKRPLTLVVVDEAHNIQDKERGLMLELLLATINHECKFAQFLLLTPFINNAREVARWLGGPNSDEISLEIDWQPNERVIGIVHPEKHGAISQRSYSYQLCMETVHTSRKTLAMEDLLTFPKNERIASTYSKASNPGKLAAIVAMNLQRRSFNNSNSIIVVHSRPDWVWNLAENLKLKANQRPESDKIRLVQEFLKLEFGADYPLIDLLSYRIGVHHAGLSDDVRSLMEWLIEDNELQFLVATTTIAQGVNFPVSGVVMASHQYPFGVDMPPEDFWNIAGRAGRISQEQLGVVALVAKDASKVEELRKFVDNQTGSLNSALIDLVLEAMDEVDDLGRLVFKFPRWSAFVQYLVHTYCQMGKPSNFTDEAEHVLRNTFGFEKLRSENEQLADRLLNGIRSYTDYIQSPGQPLSLVDSTGFSLDSVKQVLRQANREGITAGSWNSNLFHKEDASLRKMMGVLLKVPELRKNLKAVTGGEIEDGNKLALVVKDWVNGYSVREIASDYFMDDCDDEIKAMTICGQNLYGRLTSTVSWGLGALLSVTGDNIEEDEFHSLRNLPSCVYYGVNNERAIVLRLLGVSRSAANELADSMGDVLQEPITKIRNHLKKMNTQSWQSALGENDGKIYRDVWHVMERLK